VGTKFKYFSGQVYPCRGNCRIGGETNSGIKCEPKKTKIHQPILPSLVSDIPWGFFDGASQRHPPRCGVGVVIHLSATHFFQVRYAPGHGTNSKVEFSALWTLLFMANNLNVRRLQVSGDSKVVINWANKKIAVSGSTPSVLITANQR
jgi:hypothetical protein